EQKNSLQELLHVKDQLLGTISHDMRTPINSLISFTHLLENSQISQEKLKVYASQLKNTLGYTQGLMDNLLKWATSQMHGFVP
ncbi:histidine kinase dimerization/phospho-acceptor domain-containing protein, partial [Vibrio parahaemolyticus]